MRVNRTEKAYLRLQAHCRSWNAIGILRLHVRCIWFAVMTLDDECRKLGAGCWC